MKIESVFVYGTLMTNMPNHKLVKPFVKQVLPGKAKGILYDLPCGYPAMIRGEGIVKGELLFLENMEEALDILDRLECFYGPDNPNNLYDRATEEIEYAGGKTISYVYLWVQEDDLPRIGTVISDGDWRNKKGGHP